MGNRSIAILVVLVIAWGARFMLRMDRATGGPQERSNEQVLFTALQREVAKCKHYAQSPSYYDYLAEQGHKAAWHGTRNFDELAYILEAFSVMSQNARASGGETAAKDIEELRQALLGQDENPKKKK